MFFHLVATSTTTLNLTLHAVSFLERQRFVMLVDGPAEPNQSRAELTEKHGALVRLGGAPILVRKGGIGGGGHLGLLLLHFLFLALGV